MEREESRFSYETPELAEFSWASLRTAIGAGDSECADELQELDGIELGITD